jgi:hypothetical protein
MLQLQIYPLCYWMPGNIPQTSENHIAAGYPEHVKAAQSINRYQTIRQSGISLCGGNYFTII